MDDREENLVTLEAVLKQPGYRLLLARSGPEALALLPEQPALILLDVQMPVMDGFETARRIRESEFGKTVPIVFVTAIHRDETNLKRGILAGAVDYLFKPFDAEILLAKVEVFTNFYRQQRELVDRAKELEKLQAERDLRSRFVATLVHDLRNPLSAAQMSLDIAIHKLDPASSTKVLPALSRISNSIRRMDVMIETLLDAKRIEAGQPLPINKKWTSLSAMLETAVAELNALHGDRVLLESPVNIELEFSAEALRRAMENLILNALKYGSATEPVRVTAKKTGDMATITVHNLGNPIPSAEQEKIFEPFHRSEKPEMGQTKGWGLGLSLVRGIIHAHGGRVSVTSNPESGTTFMVALPMIANPPRF